MIFIVSCNIYHSDRLGREAGLDLRQYRPVSEPTQIKGFRGKKHELWISSCVTDKQSEEFRLTALLQGFTVKNLPK